MGTYYIGKHCPYIEELDILSGMLEFVHKPSIPENMTIQIINKGYFNTEEGFVKNKVHEKPNKKIIDNCCSLATPIMHKIVFEPAINSNFNIFIHTLHYEHEENRLSWRPNAIMPFNFDNMNRENDKFAIKFSNFSYDYYETFPDPCDLLNGLTRYSKVDFVIDFSKIKDFPDIYNDLFKHFLLSYWIYVGLINDNINNLSEFDMERKVNDFLSVSINDKIFADMYHPVFWFLYFKYHNKTSSIEALLNNGYSNLLMSVISSGDIEKNWIIKNTSNIEEILEIPLSVCRELLKFYTPVDYNLFFSIKRFWEKVKNEEDVLYLLKELRKKEVIGLSQKQLVGYVNKAIYMTKTKETIKEIVEKLK